MIPLVFRPGDVASLPVRPPWICVQCVFGVPAHGHICSKGKAPRDQCPVCRSVTGHVTCAGQTGGSEGYPVSTVDETMTLGLSRFPKVLTCSGMTSSPLKLPQFLSYNVLLDVSRFRVRILRESSV